MAREYASVAALRSPPHITLQMPFNYAPKKLGVLDRVLTDFSERHKPVNIGLRGFGAFPPKVIYLNVLPTEHLRNIQLDLVDTMQRQLKIFNANYRDKPFHPHVTVAFRDLRKVNFLRAWTQVKEVKFEEDLLVEELTLLRHNQKYWVPAISYKFGAKSQ